MTDPSHWLWRLSSDQWLSAAQNELDQCRQSLSSRRAAVTHARRAGGMALNAVLVRLRETGDPRGDRAESMWGRSYLDHLNALAHETRPAEIVVANARAAAQALLNVPVAGQTLVTLGRDPTALSRSALAAAETLVERCAATVATLGR